MNNAYCFCPKFLAKVPVDSIIEALVLKKNSIILDDKYKLINEYTKVLGDIPDRFLREPSIGGHIRDRGIPERITKSPWA